MAARLTSALLIARLRRMIADSPGAGAVFTDDDLQDFLDLNRQEVRYLPLMPLETIGPGGVVQWRVFVAALGDW